jgi:uncharacterized membrane protein
MCSKTLERVDAVTKKQYRTKRERRLKDWVFTIGILCLAIGALVILANVASACPTCKAGLEHGDLAQQNYAAGFYYSILFMMSMPFMILGTFGSFAYYSLRKAQASDSQPDS